MLIATLTYAMSSACSAIPSIEEISGAIYWTDCSLPRSYTTTEMMCGGIYE